MVDGDGNTGKLPWRGEGWYRRNLEVPAVSEGKNVFLIFDGIMSCPEVYLNGKLVGKWDYGYNSFYLDITKYLQFSGKNKLAIHILPHWNWKGGKVDKIPLFVYTNGDCAELFLNGNPQSFDPFQANQVKLFYGKAMIIIGSDNKRGDLKIVATSDGLVKDTKLVKMD